MNKKITHLMIGSLPPPIGGTTVLFSQLLDDLSSNDSVSVKVINVSVVSNKLIAKIIIFIKSIFRILTEINNADSVGFHGSVNGVTYFAPFVSVICKAHKKPLIVRTFGGDFDIAYSHFSEIKKYIFNKFILSSKVVLFETKKSINLFSIIGKGNVCWFPNSRRLESYIPQNHTKIERAIFLGHVNPEKGILDLVAAVNGLDLHLDIYGSLDPRINIDQIQYPNIQYRGVADPKDLPKLISSYQLLILPTKYIGEGYPGVIIEAYMAGVPVVSTRWRCIPEIVNESVGVLVEPGDIQSLRSEVNRLISDSERYRLMSKNARIEAKKYASEIWSEYYTKLVRSISI